MAEEIQILAQFKITDLVRKAHAVVGDKLPGVAVLPQDVHLEAHKVRHQIGTEPLPVQHLRGVVAVWRHLGGNDLMKIRVFLTPKGSAPSTVQLLNTAILLLQPTAEGCLTVRAVAKVPVAVAQFIVHLPAHHMGMVAKPGRHSGDQPPDVLAVMVVGLAVVVPSPEFSAQSAGIHGQDVRILTHHPSGRRCSRGAQHRLDAVGG